jgi:hypothetical protein
MPSFSNVLSTDSIPSPNLMTHPFVTHSEVCCNEVMHHLAANYQLLVSSAISGMAHKKNCVVQNLVISEENYLGLTNHILCYADFS